MEKNIQKNTERFIFSGDCGGNLQKSKRAESAGTRPPRCTRQWGQFQERCHFVPGRARCPSQAMQRGRRSDRLRSGASPRKRTQRRRVGRVRLFRLRLTHQLPITHFRDHRDNGRSNLPQPFGARLNPLLWFPRRVGTTAPVLQKHFYFS